MNYIAFILSIFIFTISIAPCSDGYAEGEKGNIVENHSEEKGDYCPPFCFCACCGTTVTVSTLAVGYSYSSLEHPFNFFYSFIPAFDYLKQVWRPPIIKSV